MARCFEHREDASRILKRTNEPLKLDAPDGVGLGSGGRRARRLDDRVHQNHRVARNFWHVVRVEEVLE